MSTAYRLVSELEEGGLLGRDADRRFGVGPLMTALAALDDIPAAIH